MNGSCWFSGDFLDKFAVMTVLINVFSVKRALFDYTTQN